MKILLGGLLLISIVFSACQKEIGFPDSEEEEDIVYIKSVVYLDSTKTTGQDTIYKSLYNYDGSNRLVNSYQAEYYYGATPGKTEFTYTFSYTGTNKFPAKMIIKQDAFAPREMFFTYNILNEITRDSTVDATTPGSYVLSTYRKITDGVYEMLMKQYDGALVTNRDSVIYRRSIINKNVISGVDSNYHPTLGVQVVRYSYNYDTRKNPFAGLLNARPYMGAYFFTGDGVLLPVGTNNALIYSETYEDATSSDTYSGIIDYTYRNDRLPVIGRILGNPDANKILFDYY